MSETTTLECLKKVRQYIRTEITKTSNSIPTRLAALSNNDKIQITDRFKTIQADIRDMDRKILTGLITLQASEEDIQKEYDLSAGYEKKIIATLTLLHVVPVVDAAPQAAVALPRNEGRNQLKLPHLPLPEFGNEEGEDVFKFFSDFENTIVKYGLPTYEKFVFVRRQLRNEPLTLVKALETRNQNYESAKELLIQAFGSEITQQYKAIKRLSEMKFTIKDDPYEYIGKMKQISESFDTLKIDTNLVLQFFFWSGMNEVFQQQFVHITNKNKPSLEEISANIFEATERYKNASKNIKPKQDSSNYSSNASTAFAANVDYKERKGQYCSLCSGKDSRDTSHSTYNCSKFVSAKAKRDRLNELLGCVKCGNVSHKTEECRFFFKKKCAKCSQFHFSFLCSAESPVNNENQNSKNESNKQKAKNESVKNSENTNKPDGTVNAKSVFVGTTYFGLNIKTGENSAVPTFSFEVGKGLVLRGMKDSGCQANFIKTTFADELELLVIVDNYQLKIGGFNSTKNYQTKIVELTLFERKRLTAICIPDIKAKLNLPGLSKIVQAFQSKGYDFADKLLKDSDKIEDLNFVLGTLDSQIIPQSDHIFGSHSQSMFSKTPHGILLSGCMDRLLENISDLPYNNATFSSDTDFCISSMSCTGSGIKGPLIKDQPNNETMEANSCISVLDDQGDINEAVLGRALNEAISDNFNNVMNYDLGTYEDKVIHDDEHLISFVLDNTTRLENGRLRMPLLWNDRVSARLSSNFNLSKAILRGNLKKLQKNELHLKMYNESILEQFDSGIIEKITNLDSFRKNCPDASFVPHMGVFKMSRETTKCRIVYLSNLCEQDSPQAISHNQAMFSGPNLNKKISTSIIKIRFDSFLLCFDIKKAFLNIALSPEDSNKLLFLWYRDVTAKDFSIIAYRCLRLPFGLRCSPTILMLGLYKILILDAEGDSEEVLQLKKSIFDLIYMDNGAVTTNDPKYLGWAYNLLPEIFRPYQFNLQQFTSNDDSLQQQIDSTSESTAEEVKLFGMKWNRLHDTLTTPPIRLNSAANSKRTMLSSIAENFDVFQINGPLLNRARLFIHKLQCDKNLSWDTVLNSELLNEWKNISKQVNSSKSITIDRFIGKRDSNYKLIAFTDSSKLMFGVVIFILDLSTNKVSFLLAKNRIVSKQLETKSIPALEFHAISLGVETLIKTKDELSDSSSVIPVKVISLELYSDSMVSLNWIHSSVHKLEKMQRKAPFVLNRLNQICKMCDTFPITFRFISGSENPSDYVTRPISYNQLLKTNYLSGPQNLLECPGIDQPDSYYFTVPGVDHDPGDPAVKSDVLGCSAAVAPSESIQSLIPLDRYSRFSKLVSVHRYVLKYVSILKYRVAKGKSPDINTVQNCEDLYQRASAQIILADQKRHYPEIFEFFSSSKKTNKSMPNIISQLNIFLDSDGLLKVRSKFDRWRHRADYRFPILLAKGSALTKLIITDCHYYRLCHAGCYAILTELRKYYYVPNYFSEVKKLLKECVICRRLNGRNIKLNQSPYREFRIDPPAIPFRSMFMDYFGPYEVKRNGRREKVYVLILTCIWSRAMNLKVCYDLSVKEFLRAFQLHTFEFGVPELVISDQGSQLVAGANILTNLCTDSETIHFFEEHGIKPIQFNQYFKGCSSMGSLVESGVKMCKRLIYGAVGKIILDIVEFEFVVSQSVHLVNKRPISFREALRDDQKGVCDIPTPITPELLLKGYDLPTIHLIPSVSSEFKPSDEPLDDLALAYDKLVKVRNKLTKIYHDEFLSQMIDQAIDKKDRYAPINHKIIGPGDLVLLKDDFTKAVKYPLAIVREIVVNDLGEVTGAVLMQGSNREVVKRHVTSLIPYLKCSGTVVGSNESPDIVPDSCGNSVRERKQRTAAVASTNRNRELADANLV